MNDQINELVAALVKAQSEIRPIQPNAINPFLKNKYADLGAHIEGILPALHAHGLTVTQLIVGSGGEVGVETILAHTSGQTLTSRVTMPVVDEKGKSSAQGAGSIISYLRRYALAAIVSAYSGDDDDGASAAKKPTAKPAQTPQTYTTEQLDVVLAHTKAGTHADATRFLTIGKVPVTATPKQITDFCDMYAFKLTDGASKEDAIAEARKVLA